jgi:hypothetical protein
METAILLAVAACLYTAVCWVCQRIGTTSSPATGLDAGSAARMPDIRAVGIAP